jgi:uncharacterized membrane protein YtjA (UPF0391 family)
VACKLPPAIGVVAWWRCAPAPKDIVMIKWAVLLFLISLVAGWFGFTGVASGARYLAKVLFFIGVVLFLIVLVFGVLLGKLVF